MVLPSQKLPDPNTSIGLLRVYNSFRTTVKPHLMK